MKLLSLEVKRGSGSLGSPRSRGKNQPAKNIQCEVIAFTTAKAKTAAKKGAAKTQPEQLVLHSSYSDYKGLLDQLKESGEMAARPGATCLVRYQGLREPSHVLFVHVGAEKKGIDYIVPTERIRRLSALVAQKLAAERIASAEFCLDTFLLEEAGLDIDPMEAAQAAAEGLWLATYKFKKYFSQKDNDPLLPGNIVFSSLDASLLVPIQAGIENAEVVSDCIYISRDLSNEPPNELTPQTFAEDIQALGRQHKLKVTVFDERKLRQEGMGLLLGVGQGSANPPRLIVMEYNPTKSRKTKTLALVGKGVTFDTGGISIKPSAKMEEMRHDMSGAATVVAAALAIARLKLPIRVICVVAAAENMPDGNAICPGHILKSRSGKTVEVNNTDAEGRLILADALDWVQDQKPDYVINAATLTGAINVALGRICAGLMGNDDDLNLALCEAAAYSGERVWELPIYSEYFDELRSEYADMRNVGDGPGGGAIKGGMFLKQFIRDGVRWAHLDIASMASDHGIVPYNPRRGGSGWGVRLLVDTARLLASETESPLSVAPQEE